MKTSISALAVVTALVGSAANAADLSSAKSPAPYIPPPPVMIWNGLYAGLNIGAGFQNKTSQFPFESGGGAGVVGGGQIGYNYQLTPIFVLGAEADLQGASIGSNGGGIGPSHSVSVNWFGTVRGRLGATLFSPNLLIYGTGGFAYADVQRNASAIATGWTLGGGAEWMFMPNWSVKAEYLYTDLSGGARQGLPVNPPNHTRFHTVRAGVNYHFSLFNPAPTLAKY